MIAVAGPLVSAWLLTTLEITPIFHRRYLLCIALPAVILAIRFVLASHYRVVQIAAILFSFFALISTQGTLQIWSRGKLVGAQRPEAWRAAASWVNRRIDKILLEQQSEFSQDSGRAMMRPVAWVASGLIEAKNVQFPLTEKDNAYLSFPLRGLYRLGSSDGQVILPDALVGGWPDWTKQIASQSEPSQHVFVFFRGDLRAFQAAVNKMSENSSLVIESAPRAFGSVCVGHLVDTD